MFNKNKKHILNYLFSKDEKKLFKNNEEIKFSNKWTNILSYPKELNQIKKTTKEKLFNIIKDIILLNNSRALHPILLLIFYKELSEYIDFREINDNDYQLINKSTNKLIRKQINITFRIYIKILNDINIKKFCAFIDNDELINNLYYNIKIEDEIYSVHGIRYCDLSIYINDEDYLFVEINEGHHNLELDFERKCEIYQKTLKIIIDYNICIDTIEIFYNKLLKQIAKLIYKNNIDWAILFYMSCISNLDINIANHFYDFYKNKDTGIKIKKIINMFNNYGLKNKIFFIEIIKTELDNEQHFIELNEKFIQSKVNSIGFDIIINLPRKSELECINEIKKNYTVFRENYFDFIKEFLDNNDKNKIIEHIINNFNNIYEISNISKPIISNMYDKLIENKDEIEKKYKIKLNKYLPFLYESKNNYDKIDKKNLKKLVDSKFVSIIDNNFDINLSYINNHKFIDLSKIIL